MPICHITTVQCLVVLPCVDELFFCRIVIVCCPGFSLKSLNTSKLQPVVLSFQWKWLVMTYNLLLCWKH